jgi:hypothetical protein
MFTKTRCFRFQNSIGVPCSLSAGVQQSFGAEVTVAEGGVDKGKMRLKYKIC